MNLGAGAARIVDRYAVFDAIASGGMATVHLGRLIGPVGFSRMVAIKRLHENFARDPEFVAMFLDEARIVGRIRHPNVVATLDVVAKEHELLLVMEYVAGETLAFLLKRVRQSGKPAPIPIVVDLIRSVLNGLHAAHEASDEMGEPLQIVHRDVSPQNIMVGTDGIARVLDFGIAKAAGRVQSTRAGQVKGKLRYMAPEQVMGEELTRTADVYAASIVLWEALTGERYIKGTTEVALLHAALERRAEPPSKLRPDVSPALDHIVLRGLSRDPAARYATAKEMATALEAAGEPVTSAAVSAWVLEHAHDEVQRKRTRIAEVESEHTPLSGSMKASPKAFLDEAVRQLSPQSPSSGSQPSISSLPPTRVPAVRVGARPRRHRLGSAFMALGMVALGWLSSTYLLHQSESRAESREPGPRQTRAASPTVSHSSPLASPAPGQGAHEATEATAPKAAVAPAEVVEPATSRPAQPAAEPQVAAEPVRPQRPRRRRALRPARQPAPSRSAEPAQADSQQDPLYRRD